MTSTTLTFASREAHRTWLATQAILPAGFRVGTARLQFVPVEAPKPATMNLTLIVPDRPTPDFAAVFTRNAFPGAPIIIGRRRLSEPTLGGIVVNNKMSNVRAPNDVAMSERLCAGVAGSLGLSPTRDPPELHRRHRLATSHRRHAGGSTGRRLVARQDEPPRRRASHHDDRPLPQGSARARRPWQHRRHRQRRRHDRAQHGDHAGLPSDRPRGSARQPCAACCPPPSIPASTASASTPTPAPRTPWSCFPRVPFPAPSEAAFADALATVCRDLAEDVVRNGEGVRHVVRVVVRGAPSAAHRARPRQSGRQRAAGEVRDRWQRSQRRTHHRGHRQVRRHPTLTTSPWTMFASPSAAGPSSSAAPLLSTQRRKPCSSHISNRPSSTPAPLPPTAYFIPSSTFRPTSAAWSLKSI